MDFGKGSASWGDRIDNESARNIAKGCVNPSDAI